MKRWTGLALFLLAAVLFLIANRGAYKGYFQDDELDNLSWAPEVPLADYAKGLATPRFLQSNFRPVGHFFYYLTGPRFGLDFPKYIFPIQALHLLNMWLLWLLARRLGCDRFAASAGALFFVFHMACFDVFWKPMYVFDLLCGTFVLATLLLWMRGWWVAAFVTFWLAYKSKELAVMLPFVLVAYEYWLGKHRWKPLALFVLAALSFGLQGILFNPHRQDDYAFSFTAVNLRETVSFYAGRVLLMPFAGMVLLFVPLVVRDRRVWFGILALLLFFAPLAFLPGRLFSAYCYVPLIGAAIALAAIADRGHRLFVAIFFLCWIPFNFIHLRLNRKQALALADENRRYVTALRDFAPRARDTRDFVYDGRPFALAPWGIQGALRLLYHRPDVRLSGVEDAEAHAALHSGAPVAVLSWDPLRSDLTITARRSDTPDVAFLEMGRQTPVWQLDEGWFTAESGYRWARPVATAHLHRPAGARHFTFTANISPDVIRDMGQTEVRAFVDGRLIGSHTFRRNGWQTVTWDLPPAPPGRAEVRFEFTPYRPSNKDPRRLGLAVVKFGFPEG